MKKLGRVGSEKKKAGDAVKLAYFMAHGEMGESELVAPCQSCGRGMILSGGDPHHKLKRSLGGNEDPENLVILCRQCHMRAHSYAERLKEILGSEANAKNGQPLPRFKP